MKHITKIRIYSSYLALGSIALYLSLTRLGWYMYVSKNISETLLDNLVTELLPSFIIALVAGILMIITYYGFLHSKKYPRYTGTVGCFFFVLYHSIAYIRNGAMQYPFINMSRILALIAGTILLILTLIFWKKLAD